LAGVIKKSDAVLDVGSLDGTDCLALAAWGIQRVVGVEKDHAMANTAQRKLRGRIGRYGRRRFCLDHVVL
jgi:tRNA1(Val) A37 N6-methylase TrmN6